MKHYYVHYYKDFGNTYNLAWVETPKLEKMAQEQGYEKITRREAEKLCAAENDRRKHDQSFSGFADNVILPIECARDDWRDDRRFEKDGYIVYKV